MLLVYELQVLVLMGPFTCKLLMVTHHTEGVPPHLTHDWVSTRQVPPGALTIRSLKAHATLPHHTDCTWTAGL